MRSTIGIIGTGKVGSTLARLWFNADYEISAIFNRTQDKAMMLAQAVGASIAPTPQAIVTEVDIVFLCVTDDAIQPIAESLQSENWHGKAIVHTSGAHSLDVLQSLADLGAMLGSFHPAFPFADVEAAVRTASGMSIAIEASDQILQNWLIELTTAIKGQPILIPEGKKALYHAALVIASNYTVTLYATAQSLLKSLETDDAAIDNVLITLLSATLTNIQTQGIPDALTGPLTRHDTGTIRSHLNALDNDTLRTAYIALARLSYPMLQQRGIGTESIEEIFQEYT